MSIARVPWNPLNCGGIMKSTYLKPTQRESEPAIAPPAAIVLRQTTEGIAVDTGAISFLVPRHGFAPVTDVRAAPGPSHPIVRTHPDTGRKALYFDPGKILRVEGLAEEESNAIIDDLTRYMVQPASEYHHQWKKGDIVIWDNRCSYHKAAGD